MIHDDSLGIDFAAVPLGPLDRANLEAGGAEPIDSHGWGDHLNNWDLWALVGVPAENVSYDGETIITANIVVVPLEPTNPPTSVSIPRADNQIFGRLSEDSRDRLKQVDGMSGGPIFALKKVEGAWEYTVIGLQSSWFPSGRIVAACPFSAFGAALEKVVEMARSKKAED